MGSCVLDHGRQKSIKACFMLLKLLGRNMVSVTGQSAPSLQMKLPVFRRSQICRCATTGCLTHVGKLAYPPIRCDQWARWQIQQSDRRCYNRRQNFQAKQHLEGKIRAAAVNQQAEWPQIRGRPSRDTDCNMRSNNTSCTTYTKPTNDGGCGYPYNPSHVDEPSFVVAVS